MRRARVPASLKGRGNKCPGRLLVLLDVAQTRAEGRGQPAAPGKISRRSVLVLTCKELLLHTFDHSAALRHSK